jgi:hypothetical protein
MMIKIPDLTDEHQKAEFDSLIRRWIEEDNSVHKARVPSWNKIDQRLTSEISVGGFSTDFMGDLGRANDPRTEDSGSPQLVSLNRARMNHEAVLGDFLAIKRKLSIQPRTKRDEKIARIIQARVEYIEDSEMFPTMVYFPAMDNGFARGLHWIKVRYDPQANNLKGKFRVTTVSARDVLVDCRSRGPFFQSARRKTHRFQLEVEEAKEQWKIYPTFKPEVLGPDGEYDEGYSRTEASTENFCTGYEVHFHQTVTHYYQATGNQAEPMQEISEEQFSKMKESPQSEQMVFEGDREEKYYAALFNTHTGTLSVEESPFGMDVLIPVVNIDTDQSLYPMGDIEIYSNLLDLLDVLVSVWLYNTKRTNKPFFDVDPRIYQQMQAEIDEKIEHGGAIPGLKGVHEISANSGIAAMVQLLLGWIQDIASKHNASMGQPPGKQISRNALQMMIARDRSAQGRKDLTVNFALTSLVKLMTRMIIEFEQEPDEFPLQNAQRGTPAYGYLNQKWTLHDYMGHLHEMYNIPETGQTPEEIAGIQKQLMEARKKFEATNQVEPDENGADGFIIPSLPEDMREFTIEQLIAFQEQSNLDEASFEQAYQPQEGKIQIFKINDITTKKDVDFNIKYSLDTDTTNDPQAKAAKAMTYHKMGLLSKADTLEMAGEPNADELVKNANEEQQMIQLATELAQRPDVMAIVVKLLQGATAQGQPQAEVKQ